MIRAISSEDLWCLGLSVGTGIVGALALFTCAKYVLTYRSNPKISDVAKKHLEDSQNTIQSDNLKPRKYLCSIVPNPALPQEQEEFSMRSYNDLFFPDAYFSEEETLCKTIKPSFLQERIED
ncbi:MAG: hypothetical protein KGQ54_04350 [Verrucomicrobia bacterium]|nr:hypothetical protein [Verrucomicrobiota bacterium]